MLVSIGRMTLQELLENKANIHSAQELADALDLSRQHASGLWNGRDPLGLRLMRRMKAKFGLSLDELAEVDEAVKGEPRAKSPKRPRRKSTDAPENPPAP